MGDFPVIALGDQVTISEQPGRFIVEAIISDDVGDGVKSRSFLNAGFSDSCRIRAIGYPTGGRVVFHPNDVRPVYYVNTTTDNSKYLVRPAPGNLEYFNEWLREIRPSVRSFWFDSRRMKIGHAGCGCCSSVELLDIPLPAAGNCIAHAEENTFIISGDNPYLPTIGQVLFGVPPLSTSGLRVGSQVEVVKSGAQGKIIHIDQDGFVVEFKNPIGRYSYDGLCGTNMCDIFKSKELKAAGK